MSRAILAMMGRRRPPETDPFFANVVLLMATTEPLIIGRDKADRQEDCFDGHIDEVRITKGVARYTANFTPPTAAFPNS
jgi:hypothetical protein